MDVSLVVCVALLCGTILVNSLSRGNKPSSQIAPDTDTGTGNLPVNTDVNNNGNSDGNDLEQMMNAFNHVVSDVHGGVTVAQLEVLRMYVRKMSHIAIMIFHKYRASPIMFRTIIVRLIAKAAKDVPDDVRQSEDFQTLLSFLKAYKDTYDVQTEDNVRGAYLFRMVVNADDEIADMQRRYDML